MARPYRRPVRRGRRLTQTNFVGNTADAVGTAARLGYRGAKRLRTGYQRALAQKQRRVKSGIFPNEQGYNQTQWHRPRRTGRKVSFHTLQNRHTKADLQRHIQYWQGANGSLSSSGFYPMNINQNTTAGEFEYNNVRIFDLSALNGTGEAADMAVVMRRNTSGDRPVTFDSFDGQTATGGTTTQPVIVESALDQARWDGKLTLAAVRLKAALYGASSKATRFCVMIVTMKDADFHPFDAGASVRRTAFYEQLVRPYVTNPTVQHHRPLFRNKMRVLRKWTVEIQPERSNEGQSAPHHHVIDIYHRFHTVLDYNREADAFGETLTSNRFETENNSTSNISPRCKRARRPYLIVMAYNDDVTTDGSFNNNVDPSMDLSIKQYFLK